MASRGHEPLTIECQYSNVEIGHHRSMQRSRPEAIVDNAKLVVLRIGEVVARIIAIVELE